MSGLSIVVPATVLTASAQMYHLRYAARMIRDPRFHACGARTVISLSSQSDRMEALCAYVA
jgi:hypothetical protein